MFEPTFFEAKKVLPLAAGSLNLSNIATNITPSQKVLIGFISCGGGAIFLYRGA